MSGEDVINATMTTVSAQPGTVAVAGDGALAQCIRERLSSRLAPPGARASVVVDTTGKSEQIAKALASVEDLGAIVLAGPPPVKPVPLDLYSDLHVRGLRIIGVRQAADEAA